jgi:hypothetical protein
MTLRTARSNRLLAWMGLLAIVLLSIVPTISQVLASSDRLAASGQNHSLQTAESSHACREKQYGPHVTDSAAASSEHANVHCRHGDAPGEDCWHKCGYCDFLTHTPTLRSFEFLAHFSTALPPVLVPRALAQHARVTYFAAAQPRGPPLT